MNLASQHLRTVTFNFMENPQTVTVLKILMAIEVTGKNVRFPPSSKYHRMETGLNLSSICAREHVGFAND